jgi:hypothetical protein
MDSMQFLLLYLKANMATVTPGYLTIPGESECDYTKIQESDCSEDSVAGLNKRQTCSELQIFVAADDFSSCRKKRKTSCTVSDADRSFIYFVNRNKNRSLVIMILTATSLQPSIQLWKRVIVK